MEVSDKIMDRLGELVFEPLMSEADEAQRKCLVTYRLSLVQPPEHIDILENRSLLAAGGTIGLRTWEAALHLGQYLSVNRHLVAGKRVLELGADTGYLSILCAKMLGAALVTSSDGSEEVVEKLADNFSLNSLDWDYNVSSSSCLRPKLLKWGHALVGTEEPGWNGGQKIDLVIGADVTYDQKVIPFLVSTLNELVELDPDTEILISATQRNADTLTVFLCNAWRYDNSSV
ncbi:putative methyltransferase-domain-containing protein [Diaporthe sp. PMI_573]|nr:putative methyltransferase-domain-containing protein [Diaporthaceae sp. PMI_573]